MSNFYLWSIEWSKKSDPEILTLNKKPCGVGMENQVNKHSIILLPELKNYQFLEKCNLFVCFFFLGEKQA